VENIIFDICSQEIAGKHWNKGAKHKLLALHGWLDNCASFDFLAPLLTDFEIVALDLAGHGHSYHRNFLGAYNIWQDIPELVAITKRLAWESFSLLGHSRGAMISALFAAAFPRRVEHLFLIDALLPEPVGAEDAPAQLARAAVNLEMASQTKSCLYPSFDDTVLSRMSGMVSVCRADAEALARRGVEESEQGFYWSYDKKLAAPSELKLSPAQVKAFAQSIKAPTLLFLASDGLESNLKSTRYYARQIPDCAVVELTGYHYLHMSTQCNTIASEIDSFLECIEIETVGNG